MLTVAAIAIAAVGIVVLAHYNPATAGFFPKCLFREATGLYCPGCGTGRAMHHLLNGRLIVAFGYNPLAVLSLPYLLYAGLDTVLKYSTSFRLPHVQAPAKLVALVPVVFILFGVLRNIPVFPFTVLAPHHLGQ